MSHSIFRPVLVAGSSIGDKFKNINSLIASKNSLYLQNQILQSKLNENETRMSDYNSVVAENTNLKEILGRKPEKSVIVLAAILGRQNQSLYDTLIIDAGEKQGLKAGDMVFASGNVAMGRVAEAYTNSSKVILFSNSGEKTQVVVSLGHSLTGEAGKDVFMEVTGRGGGNFEMVVPHDFTLTKGDQVVLPGINFHVLGIVQAIISDPREAFIKALLTSPVNIQEQKFLEVETQK